MPTGGLHDHRHHIPEAARPAMQRMLMCPAVSKNSTADDRHHHISSCCESFRLATGMRLTGRGLDGHGESFETHTTADAIAIRYR